jgi:peptide/nickel transport system substrate-binding protein
MIRSVMRRVVAVAAATALITAGFAGVANAATKTLTIGDTSDPAPSKYDPYAYSDAQAVFFEALYDQLFVRTAPAAARGVKGSLVTKYTVADDKKSITMTLRDNVRFADGTKVDAATVKANLDRRADATLPSYAKFGAGGTQEITSVTTSGDFGVTVNFKAAQPNAPYEFTGPSGFIVSKAAAKNPNLLKSAPYGSGPYYLDANKSIKANTYRFQRNPAHWNKAAYPYDVIIYKVYATAQAHANASAAGQLDVTLQPGSTSVPLLKARKVGLVSKGGNVYFMQWWDKLGKNYAFTEDKNVRLAFSYATDREALVKGLFSGDRATASLAGKTAIGYSAALDSTYKYNLAKAKALLAASKYPNPTFTIVISANDASIHEALKQQWAKAGITMNVKIAANGGELFGAVRTGAMGIFSFDTNNLVAWGGLMLNSFPNYQSATNAAIGGAFGALAGDSTNAAKAKALNEAIVNEAWSLPLRESYSYVGYKKSTVKALKIGVNGTTFPLLTEILPVK